jgi:hypothetical protein
MAKRAPRFSTIPQVPHEGLGPLQYELLNTLKENVELLTGGRGVANRALTSGQITIEPAAQQTSARITASGAGNSIDGVSVPSLEDYAQLMSDVQGVMNDVATLRNTLNALIQQLRSQ